jgi:DNA-binding transcriptional MerR regulator
MIDTPSPGAATDSFSLEELCTLANLPRRTVRYYIQLGLVDRPQGETRAARYRQKHLEQLLLVKKWTQEGVSLERIRELQADERQPQLPLLERRPGSVEVWTHLLIDQGVELKVEPKTAGLSPEQLRELLKRCMAALADIRQVS